MKTPITYAKAQVFRPGYGLEYHSKIQQHVGVLAQEPDFKNKVATIVIPKRDLKRLFPAEQPREFYISANGLLTYVALKAETGLEGEERFADAIALNSAVLTAIFDGQDDMWVNEENMPWLRFMVLANEIEIEALAVNERIVKIDQEEYKQTHPMWYWNGIHWSPNGDPIEADAEPVKPKIHLKDIPLTNRDSRRLVRNTINQHREALEDAHTRSGSSLSFDEWMVQNQGVNIPALQQLEGIDALPDDEYVDAMVKFKQAEVTAYHNVAVQKGETDKHLFDWCVENFGEEFQHVGRKDAQMEIDMHAIDPEIEDDGGQEEIPAVFVVTFDGTIVEDQRPAAIGPESPFAVATLKALKKNGHAVFIFTGRKGEDREAMLEFLQKSDFTPSGTVSVLLPDDVMTHEEVDLIDNQYRDALDTHGGLAIDYLIDHKQFGVAVVQISGKANAAPTFFWGDLVDKLRNEGYLSDEDVDIIKSALDEQASSL
ncbi:hypothetical protein [Ralstonia phage RSF1]|uniref:Uncharacterized protein n=1 Tax=Ralstonia phage RSF1 TaxID=1689679 RepID=A0A0K2QRD3_9CAUD|nr:hypothetical protein AVU11_gp114 [Ralstonia phage RSF1]BAS04906.1 hypothetical protein [Ralstonia phage RSF1]